MKTTRTSKAGRALARAPRKKLARPARRRAPADIKKMTLRDIELLVHDLQVHEIELQMQNEELRRTQHDLADARDQLADLYDFAPAGYLSLDGDGTILQANLTAARLLGIGRTALKGRKLARFVARVSQDDLHHHSQAVSSSLTSQTCQLTLRRADGSTFPAQMETLRTKGTAHAGACCRTIISDVTGRMQLEKEVLRISEMEQARIGYDLHDGVGQTLTGVGSLIDALEMELAGGQKQAAQRVRQLVQRAVKEVRRLSHGLSPLAVQNRGIAGALRLLAETVRESHRTECVLDMQDAVTAGSEENETHLFRIAQEAVNNALRHGKAGRITITLARDAHGGLCRLVVADNGSGMKRTARKSDGIGLRVMAYRARQIGGSLEVGRRPGGGVRITCSFPCGTARHKSGKAIAKP